MGDVTGLQPVFGGGPVSFCHSCSIRHILLTEGCDIYEMPEKADRQLCAVVRCGCFAQYIPAAGGDGVYHISRRGRRGRRYGFYITVHGGCHENILLQGTENTETVAQETY